MAVGRHCPASTPKVAPLRHVQTPCHAQNLCPASRGPTPSPSPRPSPKLCRGGRDVGQGFYV
eukprot:7202154-Alexandrium_andersonii.AAC.1